MSLPCYFGQSLATTERFPKPAENGSQQPTLVNQAVHIDWSQIQTERTCFVIMLEGPTSVNHELVTLFPPATLSPIPPPPSYLDCFMLLPELQPHAAFYVCVTLVLSPVLCSSLETGVQTASSTEQRHISDATPHKVSPLALQVHREVGPLLGDFFSWAMELHPSPQVPHLAGR